MTLGKDWISVGMDIRHEARRMGSEDVAAGGRLAMSMTSGPGRSLRWEGMRGRPEGSMLNRYVEITFGALFTVLWMYCIYHFINFISVRFADAFNSMTSLKIHGVQPNICVIPVVCSG